MGDPVYKIIRQFHLKGLLVEPLPEQFKELCENYKDERQLKFENCAISEIKGSQLLYRFKESQKLPAWAYGMASFNKSHLLKFKDTAHLVNLIEEIQVPTMTLNDLIKKHDIESVDILQIDTEGYDYNIIKMLFYTKIKPKVINYEHEHLNAKENAACKQLLLDNDYKFITYGRDILAIHSKYELSHIF